MGAILQKTAYEWETVVTGFDVDRFKRIKISALLKLHQQVGELHLNEFGTSSDLLKEKQNLAFVFTKTNVCVHRLPLMNEKIIVRTWCSSLKGVRFTRNYVCFSKSGETLTEAKAEVVIINLSDRKLVRPKVVLGFENFLYNEELPNSCGYPEKIDFSTDYSDAFERNIRFSDIDFNGHVNNTVYADFCMDCLPENLLDKPIKQYEVNFIKEILPNSLLTLKTVASDTEFTVLGEVLNETKFIAKLKF